MQKREISLPMSVKEKIEWMHFLHDLWAERGFIKSSREWTFTVKTSDKIDDLVALIDSIISKTLQSGEPLEYIADFYKVGCKPIETLEIISIGKQESTILNSETKEFITLTCNSEKYIDDINADMLFLAMFGKFPSLYFLPQSHSAECAALNNKGTDLRFPDRCNCKAKQIFNK